MKPDEDYILNDGDLLQFDHLKAMFYLLHKKVAVVLFFYQSSNHKDTIEILSYLLHFKSIKSFSFKF